MADDEREVDWVTQRAAWTTGPMFEVLADRVKADVNKRNDLQTAKERASRVKVAFLFHVEDGYLRAAARNRREAVTIFFDGRERFIQVSYEGDAGSDFKVKADLDADGRPRYFVDGIPLTIWQVARKALDPVLFPADVL